MSARQGTVRAVWDDDLTDVADVPADRIREAVERARDAFWQSIVTSFPEVTSGDMGPGDDTAMEWGTNDALLTWLGYNHPSAQAEYAAEQAADEPEPTPEATR